jgi:hypothetical protein
MFEMIGPTFRSYSANYQSWYKLIFLRVTKEKGSTIVHQKREIPRNWVISFDKDGSFLFLPFPSITLLLVQMVSQY